MLDQVIVFSYLIIMIICGAIYGRNIKCIKDYAIAGKRFGTIPLVLTFLATSFGAGSVIGDITKIMKDGLIFYVSMSGFFVFCFYMSRYLSRYFDHRFDGMISAADMMRYFYGREAEVATAVCGFVVCTMSVAGQIIALGNILEEFFLLDYKYIVIIIGSVVTLYSAMGGIKAVTITDIIQFVILILVMPAVAFTILDYAGGISHVIKSVPSEKFSIFTHEKFPKYGSLFFISMLPFLWIYPPLIQRFLMTKSTTQISKMYNVEFITRAIFMTIVTIIALSSIVAFPDIEFKKVISSILDYTLPDGVRGLAIIAILAASMSTADSHLNSCSILISENIFSSVREGIKLSLARIATIFMGMFSIFLAVFNFDIVDIVIMSFGIWGSAIGVPLIAGILNFNAPKSSFRYCFIFATITVVSMTYIIGSPDFIISCVAIFSGCIGYAIPYIKIYYKRFVSNI